MSAARPAVVVGIDGSDLAWSAFDWAAAEAAGTGRPLLVVHAGDERPAGTDPTPYGRELLDDAVARLADVDSPVPVTTRLAGGAAADLLLELAREHALLVLGAARPGHLNPLGLGSVPQRVLGRACCPVVVVRSGTAAVGAGRVVVGVSPSPGGLAAMRFACVEARLRSTSLVAVRSWAEHDRGDDGGLAGGVPEPLPKFDEWERAERELLDSWLARARAEFPDVAVEDELSSTPAYWTLERHSRSAGLLVLGCRRGGDARLPRLGPVTHWVLQHAVCPVAVVGHSPQD